MKKQLVKLAGASVLAFSLSFLTFMSLTIAAQEKQERQDATTIYAEESTNRDTASVSLPD